MKINIDNLNAEPQSRLPNQLISFNPSDPKSVDKILSDHGPEGAYEIANVLMVAVNEDIYSFDNEDWL